MADDYWNHQDRGDGDGPNQNDSRRVAMVILLVVATAAVLFGIIYACVNFVGDQMAAQLLTEETAVAQESESTSETEEEKTALSKADSEENTAGYVVIDVSDVVAAVKPSVVCIVTQLTYTTERFGQQFSQTSPASGSGVIIGRNSTELLIVTNNHVVTEDDNSYSYSVSQEGITVEFIDGTEVDALVKGTDEDMDLAVLAVKLEDIPSDTMDAIATAQIGDSESLREGEGAIAVGNAEGYGLSVTFGIISATDREITTSDDITRHVLQTDAAINPGNSGGGLFNTKGELIGINEAKATATEIEGMGYALPITDCVEVIENLMNLETKEAYPEAQQGYLGVGGQDITEDISSRYGMPQGLWVNTIQEGSPAELAGIQTKDIITAIDGQTVTGFDDLRSILSYYTGGNTVTVSIQRVCNGQYESIDLTATLGFRSDISSQ